MKRWVIVVFFTDPYSKVYFEEECDYLTEEELEDLEKASKRAEEDNAFLDALYEEFG